MNLNIRVSCQYFLGSQLAYFCNLTLIVNGRNCELKFYQGYSLMNDSQNRLNSDGFLLQMDFALKLFRCPRMAMVQLFGI